MSPLTVSDDHPRATRKPSCLTALIDWNSEDFQGQARLYRVAIDQNSKKGWKVQANRSAMCGRYALALSNEEVYDALQNQLPRMFQGERRWEREQDYRPK